MEPGSLSKVEKRNVIKSKKCDNDILSTHYEVIFIFIFLIYDQFGAIRKLDAGCKIHNIQFFINNSFLSNKS